MSNKSSGQLKVGVYFLHNQETEQTYIGSGSLLGRKSHHFNALERGEHANKRLQDAYDANNNFEFKAVEVGDRTEAYELEQGLIDYLSKKPGLLNVASDVKSPMKGRKHSEETLIKISEAQKGHEPRPMSAEGLERMRKANQGNKYRLGKTFSEDSLKKMSQSHTERMRDQGLRDQISAKLTGVKRPQEVVEKQIERLKAHAKTDAGIEHNKRMVQASVEAISVPVEINGKVYPSITAACVELNVPISTAINRLKNPNFSEWKKCPKTC